MDQDARTSSTPDATKDRADKDERALEALVISAAERNAAGPFPTDDGQGLFNASALEAAGRAMRCDRCGRLTHVRYLDAGRCPECRALAM